MNRMLDVDDIITIVHLPPCDELSKAVDINKIGRSYEVHDIILDDNDPRSLLKSTVRWDDVLFRCM